MISPAGANDRAAFERAVLPHLDAAYNLARHLLHDPALAQDATQEAMLRALRYFASYRGGDARAWLLQIVRRACYDALAARRQAAEQPFGCQDDEAGTPEIPDPAEGPEAAFSRRQDGERLAQALARLPPELRECLVLRELEEMSYRDIARVTGVAIGTVMSRLWRARRALMQNEDP